ncbi:ABC transporter substrate-binding protein [Yersinia pestis]|nr:MULTISPECIES: extracellular solute-binding protein [Yersinia pseudotuberculosis complex]ERP77659.1 ABC transporter substrate-binding protein [Yersinia pestis S3]ERP77704.1 ABC transporter substrate-binding protein [Yersinia pestis 24H]CQD58364.1 sugar binding protein [Yersinia intermedia]AAM87114.1 putative solute-binding periplasmic protein of ABC transporter [Yersinia pestis KIM10+]ABG15140.1 putative sugar binding protein [Yersinia pestis Antiqua]
MKILYYIAIAIASLPLMAAERLEIMVPSGSYVSFMRNTVTPEFNKLYPEVNLVVSNDEQLDTRMAAGDNPNVYIGVFGYQPAKLAKLGKLAYLDKFPGFAELNERIDPHFLRENFGRTYYIPWNATTQMMIYNKELFAEAGLDPERPPATWDEFLLAAEKISALPPRSDGSKVYGTVFWNDVLSFGSWYWNLLAPMYYNVNQGQYQLLNRYGTDIVFDRPDANMAQFMRTMQQAQRFAPLTMEKSFFSRNIGMWLQFGFGWKATLSSAAERPMVVGQDVAIAPIPVQTKGDIHYSVLDGRAIMIFKDEARKEQLSWALLNLLMRDDINLQANIALGQLPTLKALQDAPYFQSAEAQPFVQQLQHAILSEPFANAMEVANIILANYSKVVLKGEISPEQAVATSAQAARQLLNEH